MESRATIILTAPVTQGSGLVRLDAAGYRAYSWERSITVPTTPLDAWDDGQMDRTTAYAFNLVFGD